MADGGTAEVASRSKLRILAVIVAGGLLAVALRFGLLHSVSDTTAQFRTTLLALGVEGYAVYVVAYTFLQPFGLPGLAFTFAAALVWPWPVAYALSMIGAISASISGFAFARFVARDAVERRLPPRFLKYDARLASNGFLTIFLLRLAFLMSPILHGVFGVSKVRFSTHVAASTAAYAVPIFLICYFGERAVTYVEHAPLAHWAIVAAVVIKISLITYAVSRYLRRRAMRRLEAAAREPEAPFTSP